MTDSDPEAEADDDDELDTVDASLDFSTTPDIHLHMNFQNAPEGIRDLLNELGKLGADILRDLRENGLEATDDDE